MRILRDSSKFYILCLYIFVLCLKFKSFYTHIDHSTRCFTVRKPFGECAAACGRDFKQGKASTGDVAMSDDEDRQELYLEVEKAPHLDLGSES